MVLVALGALIAFNASMASIFITENPKLESLPNQLKDIKKERFFIVKSLTELTERFNNNEINKQEFTSESQKIISNFENKHSEAITISKSLKKVKKEAAVSRFRSFKIFTHHLGLVLSLFITPFIILTLSKIFVSNKKMKTVLYFVVGLLLIPPIFFSFWIATPKVDLSNIMYISTIALSSIVIAFALYFVYKLLLETLIKRLNLNRRIATLLNLVSSIKYDYFFRLAKKSSQSRITPEELIEEGDRLEEKIYTDLEKVI